MIDLKSYIVESTARLERIAKKAVEDLADAVMGDIDWEFLKNATDLNKCDYVDVTWIISLANDDNYFLDTLNAEPYSIEDMFKKKKHIRCVDIVDQWVEDNWEDYLDEDVVDALNDLFDIGGIIDKRSLGGGRYEAFRDFQIKISKAVVEKIKKALK
jgi:hypothetical protein